MAIWTLLGVIFDRSESQKPPRTNPLVSVPTTPKNSIAVLYGSRELGAGELPSVIVSLP